jgi:hypothetical protein
MGELVNHLLAVEPSQRPRAEQTMRRLMEIAAAGGAEAWPPFA